MKKIMAVIMAAGMVLFATSCGKTSDQVTQNEEIEKNDQVAQTEEHEQSDEKSSSASKKSGDEYYENKVYNVGDDIPAGDYIVTCTGTDYSMKVIVFSSQKDYEEFQHADQFTIGEFSKALEQYAWVNYYLEIGDQSFLGLKEGNIILLDDGMCKFEKYDIEESDVIYSGVYVVGEDIDSQIIDITCLSEYMQVTLFENKKQYLNYHKSNRWTVGEESDAINEYSVLSDYLYTDSKTSVNLQQGMILMIEDGYGEYSTDNGPIIQ